MVQAIRLYLAVFTAITGTLKWTEFPSFIFEPSFQFIPLVQLLAFLGISLIAYHRRTPRQAKFCYSSPSI